MSDMASIPLHQIREAAAAWRAHDTRPRGLFGRSQCPLSLHDRIDDLVDEVARLRAALKGEAE